MLNKNDFEFGKYNEKLAHDLIMGKSKKEITKEMVNKLTHDLIMREFKEEIAKEIVEKEMPLSDEVDIQFYHYVYKKICDFEQYLLGGSRLLGKHGKWFKNTLKKYKNSPQGRLYLRKVYKREIIHSVKWSIIWLFTLAAFAFVQLLVERHHWDFPGVRYLVEIVVFLTILTIARIVWILVGIKRWLSVRN